MRRNSSQTARFDTGNEAEEQEPETMSNAMQSGVVAGCPMQNSVTVTSGIAALVNRALERNDQVVPAMKRGERQLAIQL